MLCCSFCDLLFNYMSNDNSIIVNNVYASIIYSEDLYENNNTKCAFYLLCKWVYLKICATRHIILKQYIYSVVCLANIFRPKRRLPKFAGKLRNKAGNICNI